ncbi:MAG TPA: XRE family transcriptional regulator [Planctomycetaceae bacterium]|nr:XRE family transcriptional regulator [Planctomycetaceae bacterium]
MSRALQRLLSRLEVSPPVIGADEANRDWGPLFDPLVGRGIVRPIAAASAVDCSDCSRRCRVEFLQDDSGNRRGFIHCPDCGIAEVPLERLERWEIDVEFFLRAVFADARLVPRRETQRLWHVGSATWCGRSRQVWFVRGLARDGRIDDVLERHPKAVVFAPTEDGARRWHERRGTLVISLESCLALRDGRLVLERDVVEGRIADSGLAGPKPKRPKKRAARAANIERLERELIAHLRAARDHAFATRDGPDGPQLLPRPSQEELARRTGMSKSTVSRCFNDDHARELKLYWETALDLDRIMAFKGPVSRGQSR